MRAVLLVLSFMFTVNAALISATIHVPADQPTIQQAINVAVNGDTVLVSPGVYVENIDFSGKAIEVVSTDGPLSTFIVGDAPLNPDRASTAIFDSGEGPDSILSGFGLGQGSGTKINGITHGGGILCNGSSPTIIKNRVAFNYAEQGGGIQCINGASPLIEDCEIWMNDCETRGAGIYCLGSNPTIRNNIIHENWCQGNQGVGGGIYCDESEALIDSNTIFENHANSGSPGIVCTYDSSRILGNVIQENWAPPGFGFGFGIVVIFSEIDIESNTIKWNDGGHDDGGILLGYSKSTRMANNIIHDNGMYGVFCMTEYETPVIVNSTILGHDAFGISCAAGASPIVTNTILRENTQQFELGYTANPKVTYSNVQGGWPGTGNIDADPQFMSHWGGDYHLLYSSPCRNAGTNGAAGMPILDREGDPRVYEGTVDIGADEFHPHLYVTGEVNPGKSIEVNFVGLPLTDPVGLFLSAEVLASPLPTAWGEFHLQPPWLLLVQPVPIPGTGIWTMNTKLPGKPHAPYDVPMQALIGLNPDSLSNLCVLEVR